MDELVVRLHDLLTRKLRHDEEPELSDIAAQLVEFIPALPLQPNLQPVTTYTEQQASLARREQISSLLAG